MSTDQTPQQSQQDALRNAAEQFVAAHADGNVGELLDYFAEIFGEALALPAQLHARLMR